MTVFQRATCGLCCRLLRYGSWIHSFVHSFNTCWAHTTARIWSYTGNSNTFPTWEKSQSLKRAGRMRTILSRRAETCERRLQGLRVVQEGASQGEPDRRSPNNHGATVQGACDGVAVMERGDLAIRASAPSPDGSHWGPAVPSAKPGAPGGVLCCPPSLLHSSTAALSGGLPLFCPSRHCLSTEPCI